LSPFSLLCNRLRWKISFWPFFFFENHAATPFSQLREKTRPDPNIYSFLSDERSDDWQLPPPCAPFLFFFRPSGVRRPASSSPFLRPLPPPLTSLRRVLQNDMHFPLFFFPLSFLDKKIPQAALGRSRFGKKGEIPFSSLFLSDGEFLFSSCKTRRDFSHFLLFLSGSRRAHPGAFFPSRCNACKGGKKDPVAL